MSDSTNTRIDTADVLAIDAAVARSSGAAQFGITQDGFIAKPFARLLAEKLALARELFGNDLDLSSGSAIRKLLEVSALEDTRTWAALATMYDNSFVSTATGDALSRLGEELGIPRPFLEAKGRIKLTLIGTLPTEVSQLNIPRGARLLTLGGHHVATDESVVLSPGNPVREVAVVAFYPGPEHNLDPTFPGADSTFPQKIDRWNRNDPMLNELIQAETLTGTQLVQIEHTTRLSGGELQWADNRYRRLLLQAPRSLWTVEAIQLAVSLIPGVRQVQVRDAWGGLDLSQSIFGNFNFIERVFTAERDLGSPYYFTVLVAPTPAAIWAGSDGLKTAIESAIEDLRPIGIFPNVIPAEEVSIGIAANLVVKGLPLPTGARDVVNNSLPAKALKYRLLDRVRQYIDNLQLGETIRWSEVMWSLMNEPGIVDVSDLKLLQYPPGFNVVNLGANLTLTTVQALASTIQTYSENIRLQTNQVPVFVDNDSGLTIV
ncbi:hypothetical protein C7B80_12940 [Cyanosarcina cf. burmensis CCALA 770]|nr:hypothetical protein C7B80_12940 [Cyanosarcina cf. burmensis CCALA 770]